MPLSGDRVIPTKVEREDLGGSAADESPHDFPTPANVGADILVMRGIALQLAGATGATATLLRGVCVDGAGNLTFEDTVTGLRTLAQLAAASAGVDAILTDDVTCEVLVDDVAGNVLENT